MKSFSAVLALVATAAPAFAALATTTRYDDGQEGACGCGSTAGAFGWQYEISTGVYTAAGSQVLFDTDDSTWCGAGCGKCYQLTNQGYSACSSCGSTAGAGESIIVMVTNLCPYNGNQVWCPVVGGTNEYGYGAHFDIMSKDTALVNGSWDNPVVEYVEVACPGAAATDYGQCVCNTLAAPTTLTTSTVKSTTTTSKASTSSTTSKTTTSSTSSKSTTSSSLSTTSKVPTTSTKVSTSSAVKSISTSLTKPTTTTKATSGTTTSSAVIHTTSSIAANNGTVPLYGQCGGVGWTGGTSCTTGTCVYSNDWYSQCIITEAEAAILAAEGVQLYEQCGGVEYTGETTCALGSCQYVNDWYSQCRLDE